MWETSELLQASSIETPPDILRKLSCKGDSCVKRAITKNPNTPVEVLFSLGKRFPEELLQNPILTLLTVEDPRFFHKKMPYDTFLCLFHIETIPSFLWDLALYHPYSRVRERIAQNPRTPVSLLQKFLQDQKASVRCAVALHPKAPVTWLQELAKDRENYFVIRAVIQNPNAPKFLLGRLFLESQRRKEFRSKKVQHFWGKKYEKERRYFWLAKNAEVPVWFAKNPNLPLGILRTLVTEKTRRCVLRLLQTQKHPTEFLKV